MFQIFINVNAIVLRHLIA